MGIIVPLAIKIFISIMDGIQKLPTFGNKLYVRPSDIKRKKDVMDIFRYEHIKVLELPKNSTYNDFIKRGEDYN